MREAGAVYVQIVDDITAKIASGALQPGERLPSQRELAQQYRCSAQPVKVALLLLQHSGVLRGHQGRGVYVAGHAHGRDRYG
jgi:DNA-binding GntR family transcriptional regulator